MLTLIARHPHYSPNSEARDEALFRSLVMAFALKGISVSTFDEANFEQCPPQCDKSSLILSMARSEAALHALSAAEESGVPVLNSPRALQKAQRTDFQQLFAESGHAAKHWHISTLTPDIKAHLSFPLWWKRNNSSNAMEWWARISFMLSHTHRRDSLNLGMNSTTTTRTWLYPRQCGSKLSTLCTPPPHKWRYNLDFPSMEVTPSFAKMAPLSSSTSTISPPSPLVCPKPRKLLCNIVFLSLLNKD